MGDVFVAALATVLASTIAGGIGYLTQQRARQAMERTEAAREKRLRELEEAQENRKSHADLVREAGEIAGRVYKGTIETLEVEQREDRQEIAALKLRVRHLEGVEEQFTRAQREIRELRAELDTAKAALRIAFPDEDQG